MLRSVTSRMPHSLSSVTQRLSRDLSQLLKRTAHTMSTRIRRTPHHYSQSLVSLHQKRELFGRAFLGRKESVPKNTTQKPVPDYRTQEPEIKNETTEIKSEKSQPNKNVRDYFNLNDFPIAKMILSNPSNLIYFRSEKDTFKDYCSLIYKKHEHLDVFEKQFYLDTIVKASLSKPVDWDQVSFDGVVAPAVNGMRASPHFEKLLKLNAFRFLPHENIKDIALERMKLLHSNYTEVQNKEARLGPDPSDEIPSDKIALIRQIADSGHFHYNALLMPALGKAAAIIAQKILFFIPGCTNGISKKELDHFLDAVETAKKENHIATGSEVDILLSEINGAIIRYQLFGNSDSRHKLIEDDLFHRNP